MEQIEGTIEPDSNQIILNGIAADKRTIHVTERKRHGSSKYFSRAGANVSRRFISLTF